MEETKEFLCGVVEGFYGKPWTPEQRLHLFQRLKRYGLNTYMYAPKDDIKHRKLWREKYTEVEKDNLRRLIQAAKAHGITFVYAISPGLDIIFSCEKETQFLREKLEQVSELGCSAFALLYDDIEPELSLPDRDEFESFADAHVKLSNDIYEYLGKPPVFLFCPTEYCASRAKPNVQNSEYLQTIGNRLNPGIDIMWTGPKVVSKRIGARSIQILAKVLKRNPVIWDNIHANDYDQRRVFLGPFNGRSTNLYKYLNGVLSNPNCEYECNFVAIHTFATWIRNSQAFFADPNSSGRDGTSADSCQALKSRDGPEPMESSPAPSETRLNADDAELSSALYGEEDDSSATQNIEGKVKEPDPNREHGEPMDQDLPVQNADQNQDVSNNRRSQKPEHVSGNSSPSEDKVSDSKAGSSVTRKVILDTADLQLGCYDPQDALRLALNDWLQEFKQLREICSLSHTINNSAAVAACQSLNSLALPLTEMEDEDSTSGKDEDLVSEGTDSVDSEENLENMDEDEKCGHPHSSDSSDMSPSKKAKHCSLAIEDLQLLADLFCLPYEHGERAKHIVSDFKWLKTNAVLEKSSDSSQDLEDKQREWKEKAKDFHSKCQAVLTMFVRLSESPNKAILQELFPYIWDVKEVVLLLDAFVKWLGSNDRKTKRGSSFIPEDPEPWLFRGGIAEELERLLPLDGGSNMFSQRAPEVPSPSIYTIRPYRNEDKDAVYSVCLKTCDDGHDGHELFSSMRQLPGDRYLGAYLKLCPEMVFVVEDEEGICGYCAATSDARVFFQQYQEDWLPSIRERYPQPCGDAKEWSHEEEVIHTLFNPKIFLPEDLYARYKAHIVINLVPRAKGTSIGKRMLACVLSVLKSEGACGVYCEVSASNVEAVDFYTELGFYDVPMIEELPDNTIILGRRV